MRIPSKKVIISSIAVIAIGGIIFASTRKAKIAYETETIDRGPVVHEVTVTGSVAPFKKISLQPEVSGRVSKVNVTEGSEVKAGDVLIEIDSRDISARVASQKAATDSARARLAELVSGATPQELALSEAAVASARSKRDAAVSAKTDAQTGYGNTVAKADTQMSSKLDALLLDYDDAYTSAKDAIDRLTSQMFTTNDFLTFSTISATAENTAISTRGVARIKLANLASLVAAAKATGSADLAVSSHAAAAADLVAVKAHLEACRTALGFTSGLSSTTLTTYQSNVSAGLTSLDAVISSLSLSKSAVDLQIRLNTSDISNSQATLSAATYAVDASEKALAQAEADLSLRRSGNRAEVIAAQRANVAAQDATLAGLYADLAKRQIIAPLAAVVTNVSVSVGETASPTVPAVVLNAHGKFEIVANVSEVDIARVKVGQPIDITLDAFPASEHWSGKVAFVDPAEKVVEGVIFYETKFVFDKEDERVRSGMTANISIETDRRDNVVRVLLRALKEKKGKPYVEVMGADGLPQEKDLEIGVENNQYSEVLSGLAEGDKVIVGSSAK